MHLHLDFETRSDVDLRTEGLDNYCLSPLTDVLCAAYAFGDEDVLLWTRKDPSPNRLLRYVQQGGVVVAHNAPFELAIWNNVCTTRYGWPQLNPRQVYCTMAKCFAMSLPGGLDAAAAALHLEHQKDMKGAGVMLRLARPRNLKKTDDIVFWEEETAPEKFEVLYEYCKQDVEVEREIDKKLLDLPPKELSMWQLDYEINQTGVPIDIESALVAREIVDIEQATLNEQMRLITKNEVMSCKQSVALKEWLIEQGAQCEGVTKAEVDKMLNNPYLPDHVKDALYLRKAAAKSSTAKLDAMIKRANPDGVVKYTMQYHAASTGRWGGRGIQVQNLPRPTLNQDDIDYIFGLFKFGPDKARELIATMYEHPVQRMSDCVRGFIAAPKGSNLIAGDWSAIEARVIAWLAGQDDVLEVFKSHGKIYEAAASGIYNCHIEDVTKEQRQIGKVAVLALGYQGGKGAFKSMAEVYGLSFTDEQAEDIKTKWRDANQDIVNFWYQLERASFSAVRKPGNVYEAGPIKYVMKGSFLWCRLPSGRALCYPYPKVEVVETPWETHKEAVTFMATNSYTNKWERTKSYGGFLAENVTQAVARDVLADCLKNLDHCGYKILFHVHDEVVCEIPTDSQITTEMFEAIMELEPDWAKGLPLKAEAWIGKRYRK